jgi:NAD(P)-dependent dehydrogenase (short-subunit alcohol dehydrogenase family)
MSSSLFDLSGRVAVVSGAGSGLGQAIATGLAEFGADVVLVGRRLSALEVTAQRLKDLGRRGLPVVCDVTQPAQIDALFAQIDREFGRLDAQFNVAGEGILGRPEDLTLEQVNQVLQNLVVGRFYCCQQAGRRMLAAGKGSIVNIGSIAGLTAMGRGHVAYSMAMGAVIQMTRELSTEWSGRGVRVNAILPAQVPSPNNKLNERMESDPKLRNNFLRGIPAGRLGVSDDIKGLAVLLASDASAWITGALIPMDGGNLAKNAGGSHPGMP